MKFFMIRLKDFPDFYVEKQNSSYAMDTDKGIEENKKRLKVKTDWESLVSSYDNTPIGLTKEKYAKIWTSDKAMRHFISYCCNNIHSSEDNPTYSRYEIVTIENGKTTTQSIESFMVKERE